MRNVLLSTACVLSLASCQSTTKKGEEFPAFSTPAFAAPVAEPVHEAVAKIDSIPFDIMKAIIDEGLKNREENCSGH